MQLFTLFIKPTYLLLLLLTGTVFLQFNQSNSNSHLGITLMPHYSESLVTFNLVNEKNGVITKCQPITERNFLLMAAGEMRCNANPELINFFKKKSIPLCTIEYNQPFRNYNIDCILLDRIWKVRYPAHPKELAPKENSASVLDYVPDSLKGWANGKLNPTKSKFSILNAYGIKQTSDVIYGDSLWRFLKDICDPKWVETYKSR